uniref:N-acetyltransferase n=1 Tax=Fervidicoccus fontis TaxID=683846 RepID=A0A7J3ZL60_9CREN
MCSGSIRVRRTSTVFTVQGIEGEKPYLRYQVDRKAQVMRLLETYVPPELRGRGIARLLVEEAIRYAREQGLKIEPVCSYTVYYFVKNPDMREVLIDDLRNKDTKELEHLYEARKTLEKGSKHNTEVDTAGSL